MSPRIDRPRVRNHRLDNLISWFAASVMVTAGIIYGLKVQDDRRRKPQPPGLPPRATPAQEPLTLQQMPRRRTRPRPRRARAVADSLARLEGCLCPHLPRNPGRPPAGARRRRCVLFAGRPVSGYRRRRFVLRAVRQCGDDQQASFDRLRHRPRRLPRPLGRQRSPASRPRATASSPSAFSWASASRCGAPMRA